MNLLIDGRAAAAEAGTTILAAAREKGVDIPSLCDHPRLEPFAGCRLCLVEIKGMKGPVPACATRVGEGMDVTTSSPALASLRKNILALLLSEHPSACLICSEKSSCDDLKSTIRKVGEVTGCVLCGNNGRCRLQEVVRSVGLEGLEFPAVRRPREVLRNDPFFDRDDALCILCGRCVRVCHEVRGASVIAFVSRGSASVIGTPFDKTLRDSGCQFCGACVDVCPTGALQERAVRPEPLPDRRGPGRLPSLSGRLRARARDQRGPGPFVRPCGRCAGQPRPGVRSGPVRRPGGRPRSRAGLRAHGPGRRRGSGPPHGKRRSERRRRD